MIDYRGNLRLTKTSKNKNEVIDQNKSVTGKLVYDLKIGRTCIFRMDNYKFRVTSPIIYFYEHSNYTLFKTFNSTYKLENI